MSDIIETNDIVELKDKIHELQAQVVSMLDIIVKKNKKISDLQTIIRTWREFPEMKMLQDNNG